MKELRAIMKYVKTRSPIITTKKKAKKKKWNKSFYFAEKRQTFKARKKRMHNHNAVGKQTRKNKITKQGNKSKVGKRLHHMLWKVPGEEKSACLGRREREEEKKVLSAFLFWLHIYAHKYRRQNQNSCITRYEGIKKKTHLRVWKKRAAQKQKQKLEKSLKKSLNDKSVLSCIFFFFFFFVILATKWAWHVQ